MAATEETQTQVLRTQVFDKAIKGIAERAYKFKQAVTISPTSAWKNFFYRESNSVLTGQTGNAIKGVPRGAEYPQAVVQWEQVKSVIDKYGLESTIAWEDIISNDIDVQERTLFRIAEGVTKAVDDEIYNTLSENDSVSNIQSINIVTSGVGGWNESSAAVIDNLENGEQLIAEQNYDTSELLIFVNPRDKRSLVKYLTDKGAQFPNVSEQALKNRNGLLMELGNKKFIVSNSVPASRALMVVPKRCATWRELYPLTTVTEEKKLKSVTVRCAELGVTQLTDPKAVVLFIGTARTV